MFSWLNWFKSRISARKTFLFFSCTHRTNCIKHTHTHVHSHAHIYTHTMTSGNILPSLAFPFVCHLFFSVGKICNLHKGRVGDRETMRATMPDSKSAALPFVSNMATFFIPEYLFFRIYFHILRVLNGVTVVSEGKKFWSTNVWTNKKRGILSRTYVYSPKRDSTCFPKRNKSVETRNSIKTRFRKSVLGSTWLKVKCTRYVVTVNSRSFKNGTPTECHDWTI